MDQSSDCCGSTNAAPERNRYFTGKLLGAEDFSTEQRYFRDKLRRHNRLVHGVGVLCGLEVRPAGGRDAPWRIEVSAGCALGPYGDEILVCEPVSIDLASYRPPASPQRARRARAVVFVTLEYAEAPCAPQPTLASDSLNGTNGAEAARIRESFAIRCSADRPPAPSDGGTLCELLRHGRVPACPPCPADPRLVLAQVTLPPASVTLRSRDVDNGVRPMLFSLAAIQQQLVRCCCAPARPRRTTRSARGRAAARTAKRRRRAAPRPAR